MDDYLKMIFQHDGKPLGLKDKNGQDIIAGDIVRFWFCADRGAIDHPDDGYSEMIDVASFDNTRGSYPVLWSDIYAGAYANRYNDFCEVIGHGIDDLRKYWDLPTDSKPALT